MPNFNYAAGDTRLDFPSKKHWTGGYTVVKNLDDAGIALLRGFTENVVGPFSLSYPIYITKFQFRKILLPPYQKNGHIRGFT